MWIRQTLPSDVSFEANASFGYQISLGGQREWNRQLELFHRRLSFSLCYFIASNTPAGSAS
jgi:hypothetical protein